MCDGKEDGMERQWKKRVFRDETVLGALVMIGDSMRVSTSSE
jgi:hypothetical protein